MNGILSVSSLRDVCAFSIDFVSTMFGSGDRRVRVVMFLKNLVHFLTLVCSVGVVTTETTKSKKLRKWDDISVMRCE